MAFFFNVMVLYNYYCNNIMLEAYDFVIVISSRLLIFFMFFSGRGEVT